MLTLYCLALAAASAQTRDAETCVAGTGVDLLDIEICTRALRWGAVLPALTRATLHSRRGRAHAARGELPPAIADFDTALRLNPSSASTYLQRAVMHHELSEYASAVADYGRAIALFPNYAQAYHGRGTSRLFLGDAAGAVDDYSTALGLHPWNPEPLMFRGLANYQRQRFADAAQDIGGVPPEGFPYRYLALWRFLATTHAGGDGRLALLRAAARLDRGEWPRALLGVYLGDLAPASALAAARELPAAEVQARLSEASFYLAELARLQGDRETAAERYAATAAAGFEQSIEHLMARAALSATDE